MQELSEKLENLQVEGKSIFTEAEQNEIVKRYMNLLFLFRKRNSAPPALEKAGQLLEEVKSEMLNENLSTIQRIRFAQKKVELERFIEAQKGLGQAKLIEEAFIKIVGEFSRRKGIEYAAWRELGVSTMALKRGGMQPKSVPMAKLSDTEAMPIPNSEEWLRVYRQMDLIHKRRAQKAAKENDDSSADVVDLADSDEAARR